MRTPSGRIHFSNRFGALLLGVLLGLGLGAPAQGALLIANAPLFLTVSVLPAMIMAVDDSGSMDSEVLVRSNDGALWWHTTDRSFTGRDMSDGVQAGVINFNKEGGANGTWKKYVYLFPNGTGLTSGKRAYADSTDDHYAVPPIGTFAFARSPAYNYSYFNPANTYEPWPNLGGYTFTNSNPGSAKTDPILGSETFNLTAPREQTSGNEVFRMRPGMTIPKDTRYHSGGSWITAASDVSITTDGGVAISYFPATFYLPATTDLPADFGYVSAKGRIAGVTGADAVIDGLAPDGSPMIRYEIKSGNFTTTAAYDAAIQNFANWFTYYRKRHIAVRGAIGSAFQDIQGFRIGAYRINARPAPATNLTIRNLSVPADRTAFFKQVYEGFVSTGGTLNRQAVDHMRDQFKRTDANAPIQEACQMNFGLLLTDGYADTWTDAGVGNKDSGMGSPFADSASNTMADIAAALYLDNPRPSMTQGLVPTPNGCAVANPSPRLDCNSNLHANLFALTMGAPGTIFKIDSAATLDPYANPPTWPTSFSNRNPVHVDDLWHATLNSRGLLIDVTVPSELGERFGEILEAISARLGTSATAAAASSATLQTGTRLYRAGFRSIDWSGTLTARALNADGQVGHIVWDAEALLRTTLPTARKIFTFNGTSGVALDFDNLSTDQKNALKRRVSDGNVDNHHAERIAWLKGSESAHASFRSRSGQGETRLLGDIVNSNPQFNSKTSFAASRPNMLYVGANDGMLHAFNAETGAEVFAYMPGSMLLPDTGMSFARVNRLMLPDYVDNHRYFVDGTPTLFNVKIGTDWKTILIGTMGNGGRTVFALDVTDPASFSATKVLWEFNDTDLGYGVTQPAIMKMRNGATAVVFGNGYNSTGEKAVLFIVDLQTGALIKKIDTGAGSVASSNGLGPALGSDWTESDGVIRQIYAGDLQGRLWRFDVSATNANQWTNAGNRKVLFEASDPDDEPQPITARPRLAIDSDGKPMILFGTGSYFRTGDQSSTQIQTLYGIKDAGTYNLDRSDLLEQTIVWQGTHTFTNDETGEDHSYALREVSDHPLTIENGWYLDLIYGGNTAGERVISAATFPSGRNIERVRFSTLIPDDDPCGTGRTGYVMDILLASGGRSEDSVFDLNWDRRFDEDDQISVGDDGARIISGVGQGAGESITVVTDEDIDLMYIGQDGPLRGKGDETAGRQSWQQLR
jgi:type IV pilus assembly protein PilY1